MAYKEWCGNSCGECNKPCRIDQNMPCSPDCELLNLDGSYDISKCRQCGCDAVESNAVKEDAYVDNCLE